MVFITLVVPDSTGNIKEKTKLKFKLQVSLYLVERYFCIGSHLKNLIELSAWIFRAMAAILDLFI